MKFWDRIPLWGRGMILDAIGIYIIFKGFWLRYQGNQLDGNSLIAIGSFVVLQTIVGFVLWYLSRKGT